MDTSIVCSIIESSGTIIAAVAAALIAKGIVKKDIQPYFQSYSYHNLLELIEKAQYNIVIITAVGDNLMRRFEDDIEMRLKAGVQVRYLLLNHEQYEKMEVYMHGSRAKSVDVHAETMKKLQNFTHKYGAQFQLRTSSLPMSASYIGIDLPFDSGASPISPDAIIQVMQYQYMTSAKDCPVTYLSLKRDKKHFNSTVASMQKMWQEAAI